MANQTNFLKLVLPANNEFANMWDVPLNENFRKIDSEIETISNEIQSARGSREDLATFLAIAHNNDGTLKPSQEQADAVNSQVYGEDNGGETFTLKQRMDLGDKEVFDAREVEDSLLANMARRLKDVDYPDKVISGAKTTQGQPNFLSSSGNEFLLNADPTPILFNINGYLMKLQDDVSVPVSGGDGTRYLVAQRPATPHVVRDRSTAQAGVSSANALNNDKIQVFQDAASDFMALSVRKGMILRVMSSNNAGDYIIDEVAHDSDVTKLLIKGRFNSAIGSMNYMILDPLRPEFVVETTYSPSEGRCYIGEGSFVGGALVSDLTYAFKGQYESQYVAVDVTSVSNFEQIFNHNLGYIPKNISILASQANDESQAVEPLSTAIVGNDLSVTINDTLAFTPGTFNPGLTDASYVEGALAGTVTGEISGSVYALRSVLVKVTKTQIFIKNVRNNHFYQDYSGTNRAAGFLKVVCK